MSNNEIPDDAGLYILDQAGEPVRCEDVLQWGQWFRANRAARLFAQEQVGEIFVSTVFLGVNHNSSFSGPPILWETMVFEPAADEIRKCFIFHRYTSRADALAGHAKAVEWAKERAAELERVVRGEYPP